jgi:predicted N-acyltransferase
MLENKRSRMLKFIVLFCVVGVALPAVFLSDTILEMAVVIAAVICIVIFLTIRATCITRVVPLTVTKTVLDEKIKLRYLDLRFEAENNFLRKELEFKHAQLLEKEEQKKRRKDDKERKQIEAELLEIERLEKIALHNSQLESRFSLYNASFKVHFITYKCEYLYRTYVRNIINKIIVGYFFTVILYAVIHE